MGLQKLAAVLFLCLWSLVTIGQVTFPKNGVYDEQEGHYAFTNATIYVSPEKKLEKATLLIKKGKIIAVGTDLRIPVDAVTIDLNGKYIYPSFIELSSNYGMPKPVGTKRKSSAPQTLSNKEGAYSWNEGLKPEQDATALFTVDKKSATELRALGFGTALTHQMDGMSRGTSALVLLGEEKEHDMILKAQASAHWSFSKGTSKQNYPSSRMGAIALLRQTYYDGKWYAEQGKGETYNISLEKWNKIQDVPQFFELSNRLDLLRADKLGDEFGVQYIFRGGGDEFLRLDAIKKTNAALVIPMHFPKAYDVSDPYDAEEISLTQMKYWELAPTNPARLAAAGIPFAMTSRLNKDKKDFWKQVRKAYQHGLSEKDLLKALTTTPAKLIKAEQWLGTLEKDKFANFIILSDNLLNEKVVLYQNWVKGKPYVIKELNGVDIRGTYILSIDNKTYPLEVKGTESAAELYWTSPTDSSKQNKLKYSLTNNTISFVFVSEKDTTKKDLKMYRLSGKTTAKEWSGQATTFEGTWVNWTATRIGAAKADTSKLPKQVKLDELGAVFYPWSPYGSTKANLPKKETVLIKNVTVWTGEKKGNLEGTDVLVEDGKIAKIAKNINGTGATIIDGTGKHLTAGIIDEHSHISISYGVNEGTQASSAEVRIGDVINSEEVNMYRQLAGGVTGAQLLHGSANPIGGQSAIIKFRWGSLPEEMKHKGADGFIKFALGENVKRSNWGPNAKVRFPQTRMGVEQVYEDHFTRAAEYGAALAAGKPVRKDLELDAILEIINKKRFVSCHSYVQSEIMMLMRIAEKHKFTLNTFTHILEGYKVADKMKAHGAGASTFSDWWAYKYEVIDAIPYNAKILDDMGVIVAINSDDAEMGRRLNQEAAKAVKYGGMSETAAWNMVTHNPAKLLHLEEEVGSIKVGKSADIVLWSHNPLSIYAKAEKTFVDGICLFDRKEDEAKRVRIKIERNRLIQKMLNAKEKGAPTQPAIFIPKQHYHCGNTDCNKFVDFNVDVNGVD
ncbi:MAG: Secreted enzyme, contains two amidohydrolase related domains [uncultured Aureispira sp.]|uniref:Secreted enzyme, contains two amidohydrolase related domains n=1 Tax=uncultured Aureispira sp. TaxID=1331704 RepID=A0A6S6TJC4_9BACT|nr:MAG: Secreted enzyme, contains two amidohydrolase related domains [uncultured Aureispira sp.]